jgi:hypothetical protein
MVAVGFSGAEEIVAGVALVTVVGGYWIAFARRGAQREHARWLAARRAREARLAAASAALDDPAFDPETIHDAASEIFALGRALAQTGDTDGALAARPDGRAISFWARTHARWMARRKFHDTHPSVELLRVVNRPGETEDRAVVRVRCRPHGSISGLDERWTLGRQSGQWVLLSAEGDPLAKPVLDEPLIASESEDFDRLREQTMSELAHADMVPLGTPLGDLTSGTAPIERQLLDLSNIDSRFDLELVAGAIAQLVETWEGATTGASEPLYRLASARAAEQLLHPVAGTNLFLQDAEIQSWKPTALDLAAEPPRLTISLVVSAVRYLTDSRTLAHRGGAPGVRHTIPVAWTLVATTSTRVPWHLETTSNPASEIPVA